jgi:hypothetical protein
MISEPANVILSLSPYILDIVSSAGVHGASEHHVMPHKHALFIAYFIEDVILILATAPQPEHVMICVYRGLDGILVYLGVLHGTWHEHVGRDVVGATHKHRDPVQLKVEGRAQAIQVWLLDPVDGPDTVPHSELVHDVVVKSCAIEVHLGDDHSESVEGLLP